MRFGRRGLPELVHEFPIDPPAVPFISDKSLRAPACLLRRLFSHSLPLPMRLEGKAPGSVPFPRVGSPLQAEPLERPSLKFSARTLGAGAPSRREEGLRRGAKEGRECQAEVKQDRRGHTRSPNFGGEPGIALCPAPQQALGWQPACSFSLSLPPSPRSWRGEARRRSPRRSPM